MSSGDLLLFTSDSSGGGSGSGYVAAEFQDTVLAPTNNVGFSSTVTTNPLNNYYADDSAPKWMSKTLFVKDLVRVEDRSLWQNTTSNGGLATYRIVWHEDFPGADGYVYGNVQLHGTSEDKYVTLSSPQDAFGVGGVIRRVVWLIRPRTGSATLTLSVDGVLGATPAYGSTPSGWNEGFTHKTFYNGYVSSASNETRDIHDFKVASSGTPVDVVGAIVYYNVSGDGIDCFAGNAFVSKNQVVMQGTTLSYPSGLSHMLGGIAGVYIGSNGQFGVTTTLIPQQSSLGAGSIASGLVTVATGSGASFPVGTAVYIPTATTFYVGGVTAVSGDVLTVNPVLPFGVSNIVSSLFQMGTSLTIGSSFWQQTIDYQPGVQFRDSGASTINGGNFIPQNYTDPFLNYRFITGQVPILSGASLASSATYISGQTFGLRMLGGQTMMFEGRCSALEFEFAYGFASELKATFLIDNLVYGSFNDASGSYQPGICRKSVFLNAGVGMHSLQMSDAGSTNILLTRVIGYGPKIVNGVSAGLLASIPVGQTFLIGSTLGIRNYGMGNIKRIHADSLYVSGTGWTLQSTVAPALIGARTNTSGDVLKFQYFGTQFAAITNSPGKSLTITLDGLSQGATCNTWLGSGVTLGFHSVVITNLDTGTVINAIDFVSPVTELHSETTQEFTPNLNKFNRTFVQSAEPLNTRPGDEWQQDIDNAVAYKRFGGGWKRMNVSGLILPASDVKTATYTAVTSDYLIECDSTGGTFTVNLPAAGDHKGLVYVIKKVDSSFTAVTIDPYAAETIDGATTTTLNTQYEAIQIECDGSNWIVLARRTPAGGIAYTPTYTGFGTVSNSEVYWRRIGDSVYVYGNVNPGTVTAVQGRITIPTGTIKASVWPATINPTVCGSGWIDLGSATTVKRFILRGIAADAYVSLGFDDYTTASSPFGSPNASTVLTTGAAISFNFIVPITGWNG